jgi:amidase
MTDWADRSATEIVAGIRAKEVSSRELLAAFLDRVERRRDLNAVVTLDVERATAAATRADEAVAAGEPLGALHGLPMTVKDAFETEGLRTTSGAPELADHVPERDADAVARLRAAGAVIFGKSNLPLYAGDIQTYNEVFGVTNNPWDRGCCAGGSSGGAAAALAARLTPLELGSDIGGSIRNPAHYCGVTGLKPTFGIVPIRGHIPGPPGSLSEGDIGVAGPMARTVPDLELALDVLAGPDETRAAAWRLELPPPRADALGGYRVATWLDDPYAPIDRSVGELVERAVGTLAEGGAKIDEGASLGVDLQEIAEVFIQLLVGVLANGYPPEVLAGADEMARADQGPLGRALHPGRRAAVPHRRHRRVSPRPRPRPAGSDRVRERRAAAGARDARLGRPGGHGPPAVGGGAGGQDGGGQARGHPGGGPLPRGPHRPRRGPAPARPRGRHRRAPGARPGLTRPAFWPAEGAGKRPLLQARRGNWRAPAGPDAAAWGRGHGDGVPCPAGDGAGAGTPWTAGRRHDSSPTPASGPVTSSSTRGRARGR